jgi:colanic acid biosynthesis glycosyl transferase WcaI
MGGGATRAYNVAKGLILNGCKVVVVSAFPHYPMGDIPKEYRWKPLKVEWFEGFKVVRTFVPPLASKGLMRRTILFLSFIVSSLFAIPLIGKVHVVWAANPNVLSMIPAMVFGFLKKCPVTMNVDDLWPEDMYSLNLIQEKSITSKIAELLARIAYHKAKLITPISPGYIRIISGKYGVELNKIHVVRAGVDIRKFKPSHSKSRRDGKFRVLYSGAFSVAYDFDQVLMATKLIEENDGNVEFIIQGGGELANHIKLMVKELGLKSVRIIDEIVSRERVAELLNTADALILPLKNFGRPYLGISSKLYEYQAVGKPIICCADGQPAEYVKETCSGIVVKPGDYKALAKAVLYLKNNSDLARELGSSGRHYVEDNLSIEKIGKEMMVVFNKVLRHPQGKY